MTDLEALIRIIGLERILKLLQEVAKEAIDSGDWLKVRQITDLVAEITAETRENESGDSLGMPLTVLNISTRCLELLQKAGLSTVNDLQRYTLESLLEINGIGEMAAQQIDDALQAQGIMLPSMKMRARWQNQSSSPSSADTETIISIPEVEDETVQNSLQSADAL